MTFLAPLWLLLLLPVVLIVLLYLVLNLRRSQYAVRFTNLDLLSSVAPRGPGFRRHVPAAFAAMLVLLVVGFARLP